MIQMSYKNFSEIADTIREIMIDKASQTPDVHLSSGLGVVELSIALNYVFNFTKDKLIFDVGHQRYPHLILQEQSQHGRLQFPSRKEYDMFCYPGFAGLAAASALGHALAHPENRAIAVIGDGALTCGETYEALNYIGHLGSNVLIILNQNDMSIVKNTGALADGKNVKLFAESLKFKYIGIKDGHDINELIHVLEEIKDEKHPIFLHVQTIKGKGYKWAESNSTKYHMSFYPFDKLTGNYEPNNDLVKRMFIETMNKIETKGFSYIEKYKDIYFTLPAMPFLDRICAKYPGKVFDTGISEQCCMTLSTTLASLHKKVIMLIGAVFLTRCYSQLYDLCHQNAPLTVILNLIGVTHYGPTHQAVYTIGLLRVIPNATILLPINLTEFESMLDFAVKANYPVFLHIPKENIAIKDPAKSQLNYNKGVVLKKGNKVTILVVGAMFAMAFKLAEKYDGLEIINPRFLKPFDYDLLKKSINKTKRLLILEEGFKKGGLGEEIISFLTEASIVCKSKIVAAGNIFTNSNNYDGAWQEYGLTFEACEQAIESLLNFS